MAVEFAFLITPRNAISLMQSPRARLHHLSHYFHVLYMYLYILRFGIAHKVKYLCWFRAAPRFCRRVFLKHFFCDSDSLKIFCPRWEKRPFKESFKLLRLTCLASPVCLFPVVTASPLAFRPGNQARRWLWSFTFDFSLRRWAGCPESKLHRN